MTDDSFQTAKIIDLPKGEFIRKISKAGTMQKKTWTKGSFHRSGGKGFYICTDESEISNTCYIKSETTVAHGFTY